ncbi:cobalamin-dependent protein [Oxyplasma meridianum]|uniref:Cobalamin-dependent protein n=1 Tax=Oxyplasma meridianum TaxID=3073602 RepID=A0AAX4NGW0_9ARCH
MAVKALFIRPSNKTGSAYLSKWGFLPAPLGLLALAGEILRIHGSTVKIIDMEGERLSLDDVIQQAVDFKPHLVGITLHATAAHNNASYIAREIKKEPQKLYCWQEGTMQLFFPMN